MKTHKGLGAARPDSFVVLITTAVRELLPWDVIMYKHLYVMPERCNISADVVFMDKSQREMLIPVFCNHTCCTTLVQQTYHNNC